MSANAVPTCKEPGCRFLASQGDTCLKHRPPAESPADRPEWRDYIRRVVDAAPPLTPAQRDHLALLLQGRISR